MTNRGAFKGVPDEELRHLYIEENLSAEEIAERYNTTASAVRTYLSRIGLKKGKDLAQKCQERINIAKLGVKSTLQLEEVQKKIKETLEEKYGTDNVLRLQEFREKAQNTTERIHGVRNSMQSEDVRNKAKQTWQKNYGVDNPNKDKGIASKRIKTLEERYGADNPMRVREFVDKQQSAKAETLRQKTGVGFLKEIPLEVLERLYIIENYSAQEIAQMWGRNVYTILGLMGKNGIHKDRSLTEVHRQETAMQIYGTPFPVILNSQNPEKIKESLITRMGANYPVDLVLSKEKFVQALEEMEEPHTIAEIACLLGLSYSVVINVVKKFDLKDHPKILFLSSSSSQEREIGAWLEGLGISFERNVRGIIPKYELDIYIPDKKLAIEFNGNYWHSELYHQKNYHQQKSLLGKERGIFIYHIFEYEWADLKTQAKIKNHLKSLLGIDALTIYARECEVKKVSSEEKTSFLLENHLQGDDRSLERYGLYYKNKLVSIMTFGTPRFNKKYDWEIYRFCTKAGVRVVGGAGRLFSHFLQENSGSVLSYSNFAKMSGGVYKALGFKMVGLSKPSYVWWKDKETLSRFQTQMKSETETMKENGYLRIYDCGNEVWEFTR